MTAPFHKTDHYSPAPQYTMPNTYLDKAIEAVPKFEERISLFTKKLRLAQYADSTIYSYRLKISQAVLYLGKLPDKFTQTDVDDYLTMLLDRNCYSLSFFKHTVFGLKDYYKYMGLKDPGGRGVRIFFTTPISTALYPAEELTLMAYGMRYMAVEAPRFSSPSLP